MNTDDLRVKPGTTLRLSDIDPDSTPGAPEHKKEAKADLPGVQTEIGALQERLWAENRRSLLVVLQAIDAGGKDGTIKHVFKGVNPQSTRVTSFKQPNSVELRHDFLWRIHTATPAAGEIGIFNRSHYEDVLTVRVHKLVPESVWRARYELINDFEQILHEGGTTIVKLYLHISSEEQRIRLEQRLDTPQKRWKFSPDDIKERAFWSDYQLAFEEAITNTSTHHAPWYVVPANHKWYRNWAVSHILLGALRRMNPRYPDAPHPSKLTTA